MFIAMLRVEIVADVIWSRELMLASWPKTRSPPTCGHLKGAACTAPAQGRSPARRLITVRYDCRMRCIPGRDGASVGAAYALLATEPERGCRDPSTQKRCTAARRRRRGWAGLGSVNGATRLRLESMGACAVSVLSWRKVAERAEAESTANATARDQDRISRPIASENAVRGSGWRQPRPPSKKEATFAKKPSFSGLPLSFA